MIVNNKSKQWKWLCPQLRYKKLLGHIEYSNEFNIQHWCTLTKTVDISKKIHSLLYGFQDFSDKFINSLLIRLTHDLGLSYVTIFVLLYLGSMHYFSHLLLFTCKDFLVIFYLSIWSLTYSLLIYFNFKKHKAEMDIYLSVVHPKMPCGADVSLQGL